MGDYPLEFSEYDIGEIERKMTTYREMLIAATIRRIEKRRNTDPRLIERRAATVRLRQREVQIDILERLLAGQNIKDIAPEFKHGAEFLRSKVDSFVSDMLTWDRDNGEDFDDSEIGSHCFAKRDGRKFWWALALQRMQQGHKGRKE